MSRQRIKEIKCPKCDKHSDFIMWESLNADLNPKQKQQLLDGTLFRFVCECGYTAKVDYAMLYHDMTHQAMVYYVSEDAVEKTEEMFSDIQKHDEFEMQGYRNRIVTTQNALREKAIIFDSELDDRVIEIIKLFCYVQAQDKYPDMQINDILFFISDGKWMLQFLGSDNMTAGITPDFYDKIRIKYVEQLSAQENCGLHINQEWALRFLEHK